MCLAIAKKGADLLYGFNLDIDPAVWRFGVYQTKTYFGVGITVGKTTYYTHGVTASGHFSNVPYMNGAAVPVPRGAKRERIDLLTDRYLRGKYTNEDVAAILAEKTLVNPSGASFHSLIGNERGEFVIAEPGYGVRRVEEDFAVLSNFPVFAGLTDFSNPFYGKDRYDKAATVLQAAGADFSVRDALRLLEDTKQTGQWGTRVSFVYSRNESAVFFCLNGDFRRISEHRFEKGETP